MIAPVSLPALALDYSAASTLHACPRKYEQKYVQRLRPKGAEAPYLTAGNIVHEALYTLYTLRWDLSAAQDAMGAYADAKGYQAPTTGKFAYLTLGHLQLCIERYFEERSERPTALETAGIASSGRETAEKPLIFDWEHPDGRVIRTGSKIDLPTPIAAEDAICDHKTTTSWLNDYWFQERFSLKHQFRVYCAGMKAKTGRAYKAAYVNALYIGEKAGDAGSAWKGRKSVPNALYGPMEFSDEHLTETWEWMESAQALAEFHAARGVWPQNEGACGAFGGCEYLDLCKRNPKVRKAIAAQTYEKWEQTGVLVSGADGSRSL
jgi:hypothetical protein